MLCGVLYNLPMSNPEINLNPIIAKILGGMRRSWKVTSQQTKILKGASGLAPDIVVSQNGRPIMFIENKYRGTSSVETDAKGRLGGELRGGGGQGDRILAVIALQSPVTLKDDNEDFQEQDVADAVFEYALFTGANADDAVRFPENGWLTGSLTDLSEFVYRSSVSPELLDGMAATLENVVNQAAVEIGVERYSTIGERLSPILKQPSSLQTRRMAVLIMLNAMIFQEMFAEHQDPNKHEYIRGISETCESKAHKRAFMKEWNKILEINYYPIFHIARQILIKLPGGVARKVIGCLRDTAENFTSAFSSHDLFGRVFQRLITDRKFLATFYTRPASAVLLANLAVPQSAPFQGGNWKDDATRYTIADFACGTGALLSSAYHRVAEMHERAGGNLEESHTQFMENALIGCDIMPASVHLTASTLAAIHPQKLFQGTCLYTLPYGEPSEGEYRIGALELLASEQFLIEMSTPAQEQSGSGEMPVELKEIPWHSANLVIMNPPFTRPATFVDGYINPAFAAFGASDDLQRTLGGRNNALRVGTCGSGNAGLASDFTALADKMVCLNGTVALVLPLSVMAGESWAAVRNLWAQDYDNICIISLSAHKADASSFSADTGIAEILFLGRKRVVRRKGFALYGTPCENPRATFVVLNKRPDNEIQSNEIARAIKSQLDANNINRLEDGPLDGTLIIMGKTRVGSMLDAALPRSLGEPWCIARIRDMTLAQISHSLVNGRLWVPGVNEQQAITIPIERLGEFSERGFLSRDINGSHPRGAFDIYPLEVDDKNQSHQCLWSHNCSIQTKLVVAPDKYGMIRPGKGERANEILRTASRAHFNIAFRFNSQPLAVAMTENPTIGGTAWANVCFPVGEEEYASEQERVDAVSGRECAFALWSNSTLGLLLHWWWANKEQSGRGGITMSRIPTLPTLNLTALSTEQLKTARLRFDSAKNELRPLLPAHRANEDEARAMIDEIILVDVLGLPKTILVKVNTIREKLCSEPSFRGDKRP